jgi:hypothetical protein
MNIDKEHITINKGQLGWCLLIIGLLLPSEAVHNLDAIPFLIGFYLILRS